MRFELRHVHEEVGLGYGLGRKHVVAKALRMAEGNLDLLLFFEKVALDVANPFCHFRKARIGKSRSRRYGDAAALANR